MRKLLCCALPILLLGSCATTRNLPPAPARYPPTVVLDSAQLRASQFEATPDSLPFVLVTPKATLFDQLRHRTPAPVAYRGLPAKIKNSTVSVTYNHVAGNQTNNSTTTTTGKNSRTVVGDGASNIEASKKAGPIIRADTGATVATSQQGPAQAGTGNQQAATKKGPAQAGDGNRATEQKASGWPWWLWLLIVAVVGTGIYRIYKRFTPT